MSEFEIEKNVEIPAATVGVGAKYPWPDMEPGDSFAVPLNGDTPSQASNSVGGAGRSWCKRNRPDCTVLARTIGDEVRVWLVEKE